MIKRYILALSFIAITLVCSFVFFNTTASAIGRFKDDDTIVRGFIWGASSQDVTRFETGKFLAFEDGKLFYSDTMYDRETTVGYQFEKDMLNRIRVDIHGRTPDPKDWITLFMDVKKDLDKKWNDPISEEFIWKDEKEKDYPDNWGLAVLTGDLIINTVWSSDRTKVTATLKAAEKLSPVLTVVYENLDPENNFVSDGNLKEDITKDDALNKEDALSDTPVTNGDIDLGTDNIISNGNVKEKQSDKSDDLLLLP